MFIVCIVLFVLGMFAAGFSFSLDPEFVRAIVFVLGVLMVCAALAIPIHASRAAMTEGTPPRS